MADSNICLLLADEDTLFLETMSRYLGYYHYEVDCLSDSQLLQRQLNKKTYDLAIVSMFLSSHNSYDFMRTISTDINTKLIITGPETPKYEEQRWLHQYKIHFLHKYKTLEQWLEQIDIMIHRL